MWNKLINPFLFTFCFCLALPAFSQTRKVHKLDVRTEIYCDHCRVCESCSAHIEEAVYKLKGIRMVTVDDKNMVISVVYNSDRTDSTQIRQAIARSGFAADGLPADPEGYARLDDCCKK